MCTVACGLARARLERMITQVSAVAGSKSLACNIAHRGSRNGQLEWHGNQVSIASGVQQAEKAHQPRSLLRGSFRKRTTDDLTRPDQRDRACGACPILVVFGPPMLMRHF